MNVNDLVYKMAARARILADQKMVELKLTVGTADGVRAAIAESIGRSRGDLIEEILLEEFVEEFPREVEDE